MNVPQSNDEHVAANETPRRRLQCITIDAESVVINGEIFDQMTAELAQLRAAKDQGSCSERANAWGDVWKRLCEIDPHISDRATSGLGCALHLINELASKSALKDGQ